MIKAKSKDISANTEIDAVDRQILRILQCDGLIQNQTLASKVGLSPPACFKRVRRLRDSGIITSTVSIVSPIAVGYPLTTVVRVKLKRPTKKATENFEKKMMNLPRVTNCLSMSGTVDYLLCVRSRNLSEYQEFARTVLGGISDIDSISSEIVVSSCKSTTEIPISD